jgi:hypothetical protein
MHGCARRFSDGRGNERNVGKPDKFSHEPDPVKGALFQFPDDLPGQATFQTVVVFKALALAMAQSGEAMRGYPRAERGAQFSG